MGQKQPLIVRAVRLNCGLPFGLFSLMAIPRLGADVVFPFVVAAPIVIMLLLDRFVHGEALAWPVWFGCLLGAAGLVLLAVA
jgi:drug/metabolite transporter (DMT)-like permease